jgi:aryl-alcohol dehydrogenase-like predicted oxidoreductase
MLLKKDLLKRFIIGGAQLSQNYGAFNKDYSIGSQELRKILNYSTKNEIFFIDIANSYKNCIKKLSKNNLKKFKIILKIRIKKKKNYLTKLKKIINNTLKQLKINKLYSIMLHNEFDFKYLKNKKVSNYLIELKKKNIIKKIGISIYNFKKIKFFLKNSPIDLIQVPFNVLDRRILQKNLLKIIKKKGVEVHVRSIFLQGLLLQKPNSHHSIIKNNQKLFNDWNNFNLGEKRKKIINCIKFVTQFNEIDKFIIGVDNFSQLTTIVNVLKNINYDNKIEYNLKLNNNKIIDPRFW